MSATRELKSPMVTVKRDVTGEDAMIRVKLVVPGSRFGPVEVVLYEYEAEALATDIFEQLGDSE